MHLKQLNTPHASHTTGKFHLSQTAGLDEATAISLYCYRLMQGMEKNIQILNLKWHSSNLIGHLNKVRELVGEAFQKKYGQN